MGKFCHLLLFLQNALKDNYFSPPGHAYR